jgi:hypothetical protein
MNVYLIRRGFSELLKNKVLKEVPPADSFSHSSPTYDLLWELFQFLQTTPMINEEFPLVKSSARWETNLMILHTILLQKRLVISDVIVEKLIRPT